VLDDDRYSTNDAFSLFGPSVLSDGDLNATSNSNLPTELSAIIKPLADNRGLTKTHTLVKDSPVLDAGDNSHCCGMSQAPLNQRGETRYNYACDIGSVEGLIEDGGFIVIPLPRGKVVVIPQ
jgi:hypothetical protein